MIPNDFFGQLTLLPYMGIMPIVIVVLSLLIGQPWKKAVQGGIKVAMGMLGMYALTYFAITWFAPAVAGAAAKIGGPMAKLTLVDVGWSGAALVLVNPMIWINILIFAAINVGLILIGVTKTLYVDFPCMWRGGWAGMVVWYVTGSYWWGTLAMLIFLLSDVFIADWNAKRLQDFHEYSSTASFPNSQNAAIIAAPLAWLLARIPGIKDVKWDGEAAQEKLGWFAEPIVIGMIAGTILGFLADWTKPLNALAVGVVAAMMFHVWPMALGVCFEGWSVFNEGLRNFLVKFMKGKREVYVAVDTSVLLGHPTVGISTTFMYPIAFLLAVFVPGVGLFPVISIQIIQWWMAHITGWTRGNIIHNLIICSVVVVLYGWAATAMAGPFTGWLQHYGMIPQSLAGVQVTNWDGGGDLRIWVLYALSRLIPH